MRAQTIRLGVTVARARVRSGELQKLVQLLLLRPPAGHAGVEASIVELPLLGLKVQMLGGELRAPLSRWRRRLRSSHVTGPAIGVTG